MGETRLLAAAESCCGRKQPEVERTTQSTFVSIGIYFMWLFSNKVKSCLLVRLDRQVGLVHGEVLGLTVLPQDTPPTFRQSMSQSDPRHYRARRSVFGLVLACGRVY
jgi:hypothetical protein